MSERLKKFKKKHGPSKVRKEMKDFNAGKKVSGPRTSTYTVPDISKPLKKFGTAEKMDEGLPLRRRRKK